MTSPVRSPRRPRLLVTAAAVLASSVLTLSTLAGCSSSKPSANKDTGASTELSTTTTTAPAGSGSTLATIPSGTATVDVGNTDLGQVLVDLTGHTLYVFTTDAPGTSSCVDDSCTKVWPPLTGTAIAVGTGVPAKSGEFKLVPRPDGTSQLTVNGQPLYTYSGDAGPGATKGQGVGGSWWVVGLDGNPIKG
jgi:predicted lipoprotein with Yx(FWY)xxD motif